MLLKEHVDFLKEHLHYIFFLLIIFLIMHLSVDITVSHIFLIIFYKYFLFHCFLYKERLNANLKTELQNKFLIQ